MTPEKIVPPEFPRLIDIETLAELLSTTVRHIRDLVAKQKMPYLRLGRLLRFDLVEILAWLEERRQPPKTERTHG